MSGWKTNTVTNRHFRSRMAHELGREDCKCHGECIGRSDPFNCPFPGYKKYGGYCRECFESLHPPVRYTSTEDTEEIPLSAISLKPESEHRKFDLEFYRNRILRNEPIDPILLEHDFKGRLIVKDGQHRFLALKALRGFGYSTVRARIVQ